MKVLKRLFDFYLQASLHVALSCAALVLMTLHMFHFSLSHPIVLFVFFGTIAGYNFVKYDALARTGEKEPGIRIRLVMLLSIISLFASGWFFLHLEKVAQLVSMVFVLLTLLYTLPFFPNRSNARNWAGIKIYIVSFCWAGVTVIMPVLNADPGLGSFLHVDVYLKFVQRLILVFALILIFEIIDLSKDDPHLQTVPQKIGVKKTKMLGLILLMPFYFLEFLRSQPDISQLYINLVMVVVTAVFLAFANERKSRYYTAFWVESIPVFWWILVLLFG
ncbi:MAG: hypothetical protein CFE23_13580 [Flavobacterium sp. BFFFF1]|uniref:hypothetical protein n=1 Tax=unclassified Flavobacterium TaxID=196869 RepID=UPI000BCE7E37|nr:MULTISPECIES: hypothetical protein [unclassified Flavobacterium]OYU79530.1 MAG: hypothetical protein CFE23_13580 [Flavobacterium sp. BFFFF1]